MKLEGTFKFDADSLDGTITITDENVVISGGGFQPGSTVQFDIHYHYESDVWKDLTIDGSTTADDDGVATGKLPRQILDFKLLGVTATLSDQAA